MNTYCTSILITLLCSMIYSVTAQKRDDQLTRLPYTSSEGNEEREAYVYLPNGYKKDPNRKWPVIVFLHGDGERGNGKEDLDYLLKHGPLYEAWVQKKDLPFIIIAPQLPLFGRETVSGSLKNRDITTFPKRQTDGAPDRIQPGIPKEPMKGAIVDDGLDFTAKVPPNGWERRDQDVIEILKKVLSTHQADANRVYLTGLSYGGTGTWYIASKHPQYFAAISPIAGWGHPDWMEPIAKNSMPVWAITGGRDPYVLTKYFFTGVNKLETLGHKNVRFTIHEDMGHDAWIRAYAGDDLYTWFLSNVRK